MKIEQKAGYFGLLLIPLLLPASARTQSEVHGRKYQPPPATGHIVIQVEKGYNDKPLENAAVIFHATKGGKDNGNLEIKTNSQGKATMDFLEVGSHVTVQVISHGYATAAEDFDVTDADQNIVIKMLKPREQISAYTDNDGRASTLQPGIQEQEHRVAPTAVKATTASVTGTLKDEYGGRIPGGVIRLHQVDGTTSDRTLASDAVGNFKLDRIAPGTYDLQVTAPGYTDRIRRNLVLGAGDSQIYVETLHTASGSNAPPRTPLPPAASGPQ